ncbi:MAG: LamG-like jellyroll fold domain-containing protein, partial [Candidatus Gracilibacteria bacterium]|nr:LamG-like jellyroll fold domain-containing protein [Candidatus Gracilibacteria bacterium]
IDNGHIYAGAYNSLDWGNTNRTIDLGLVNANEVYTIIFVYSDTGDFIKAYLDGNLINTLNTTELQTTHGACTFETSFNCNIYLTGGTLAIGSTKNDTLKLSNNTQIVDFEGNFFKGNIGEISSYNYALTQIEVDGLTEYFNTKWGLNSAPGKIFHFDAQNTDGDFTDFNEPVNNSTLGTWVDINKGYNSTQTVVGNTPIYSTGIINGLSAIKFDGVDDWYDIANQTDINSGNTYDQKSFSMIMKTGNDVNTFQVLYEQGGGTRGYAIQIENGNMYMGAWNNAEWVAPDQYKFINLGAISPNTVYNILLIQDSTSGIDSSNIIKAYIDGSLAGTLNTVDIQIKHGGNISVARNSGSRKYDGSAPGDGHYFNGYIGEFISWNNALTDIEIADLNNYLNPRWNLDTTAPVINSTNVSSGSILPGGNHNIIFDYTDSGTGSTGVDTTSGNMTFEKWDGTNWISNANISNTSTTTTQAIYATNNLAFGKYRITFNISDNAGNTSLNSEIIFYIDIPELIISTGSVNIGELNDTTNTFGNTITIIVKTIGTPFRVKLKKNLNLELNTGEFIPYYDGITGMGYDKNNDGTLFDFNDDIVGQEVLNVNTDGNLNTYIYTVKMGAIVEYQQLGGAYSGKIDFGIELDY